MRVRRVECVVGGVVETGDDVEFRARGGVDEEVGKGGAIWDE